MLRMLLAGQQNNLFSFPLVLGSKQQRRSNLLSHQGVVKHYELPPQVMIPPAQSNSLI